MNSCAKSLIRSLQVVVWVSNSLAFTKKLYLNNNVSATILPFSKTIDIRTSRSLEIFNKITLEYLISGLFTTISLLLYSKIPPMKYWICLQELLHFPSIVTKDTHYSHPKW